MLNLTHLGQMLMFEIPPHIRLKALDVQQRQEDPIACFIYDLDALSQHVNKMKASLPNNVEIYYAAKANIEAPVLGTIAPLVDGLEVSSGGEILKIQSRLANKPFIFSGPGKLDSDLRCALEHNVEFIHVESINEIKRLNSIAEQQGVIQDVLLRINPILPSHLTTKLAMAGAATPFGIEEAQLPEAIDAVEKCSHLRLCGFHIHAMSHQTEEKRHIELISWYLERWKSWTAMVHNPEMLTHLNVGGGIGVRYLQNEQFDWSKFCEGLEQKLEQIPKAPIIRFEIGRYISAFCGYYIIQVLDIKSCYDTSFLVCRGGTHQFRLPVAQNHDHPIIHIPVDKNVSNKDALNNQEQKPYTIVGQLCTPKDILSRNQYLNDVQIGDLLVLPMAGAYGYNISHKDFLCHAYPKQYFMTNDV